jgi:sugar O-acyltransferase (sialic acid O-acetyltransferase NeuD family)
MANVIIFGNGKGAAVAHRYLTLDSDHKVCAFATEREYLKTTEFRGLPVLDFTDIEEKYPPAEYKFFVPLGSQNMNKLRQAKYEAVKAKGYECISYVSSNIPFRTELEIGENCFILENNSINFEVRIGNNVTIWSANQIGDRSVIEDHCWIASHVCISGDVTIRANSFIGINATLSNDVVIAEENFIGANALITKSTGPKEVYLVPPTAKAALNSERFSSMLNKAF